MIISSFSVLKALLPEGYIAVRTVPGYYEIYNGGAHTIDNWVGDITYQSGIWTSYPRGRQHKAYHFAINAVSDLIIIDSLLPQDNPTPPF
jgi:hypothetical protein